MKNQCSTQWHAITRSEPDTKCGIEGGKTFAAFGAKMPRVAFRQPGKHMKKYQLVFRVKAIQATQMGTRNCNGVLVTSIVILYFAFFKQI